MSDTEENNTNTTAPEEIQEIPESKIEEHIEEKPETQEETENNNNDNNGEEEIDDMFGDSDGSDKEANENTRLAKVIEDDDDDGEGKSSSKEEKKKFDEMEDFDPFNIGNEIANELDGNTKRKNGDIDDFIDDDVSRPKKKRSKSEKSPSKKSRKSDFKEDEYDESGESISTETGSSSRSKKNKEAAIEEKAKEIIDIMNEAFENDVECVKAHKIPYHMINKLGQVQEVLSNCKYHKALENNGVFFALSNWLRPLKGSLPLAETRGKIINHALDIVKGSEFIDNSFNLFKDSDLTARIYYLYKNDTNPANRQLAKKFIDLVSVAIVSQK